MEEDGQGCREILQAVDLQTFGNTQIEFQLVGVEEADEEVEAEGQEEGERGSGADLADLRQGQQNHPEGRESVRAARQHCNAFHQDHQRTQMIVGYHFDEPYELYRVNCF